MNIGNANIARKKYTKGALIADAEISQLLSETNDCSIVASSNHAAFVLDNCVYFSSIDFYEEMEVLNSFLRGGSFDVKTANNAPVKTLLCYAQHWWNIACKPYIKALETRIADVNSGEPEGTTVLAFSESGFPVAFVFKDGSIRVINLFKKCCNEYSNEMQCANKTDSLKERLWIRHCIKFGE